MPQRIKSPYRHIFTAVTTLLISPHHFITILRFVRMNGGNNATKYNWRKKISSHPDWYNNVYENDWDQISQKIAADHPEMQVMWAFQLLGRVASTTEYNFNDWEFNQSQYWEGHTQNLAGGGVPNTENPKEGRWWRAMPIFTLNPGRPIHLLPF